MRYGDLPDCEKRAAIDRVSPIITGLQVGDRVAIRGPRRIRFARVSRVNDAGMRFIEIWSVEKQVWSGERRLYPVDLIF